MAVEWVTTPSPSLPRRTGEGVTAKQERVGAKGGGVGDRPSDHNWAHFRAKQSSIAKRCLSLSLLAMCEKGKCSALMTR